MYPMQIKRLIVSKTRSLVMRARVYDRTNNSFYISEVYGIINRSGDWFIVDHPTYKKQVILVEYLNFNSPAPYEVNIEIIDTNPFSSEQWIYLHKLDMDIINTRINNIKPLQYYNGFESIWKSSDALICLLETGSVDKLLLNVPELSTKLLGWHYIENNNDIYELMSLYSGFHDSVIKEISYISGEYYDAKQKVMHLNIAGSKQVKVIFNSDWAEELEIVLLAPRIIHFLPGEENYFSSLMEASILIKDQIVYFYDSYIETIEENYKGTYFKSMGLMWKIKTISE